jgi:hypothetical protein
MILRARQITAPKFPRQKHTPAQRAGLTYQRKVTTALRALAPKRIDIKPTPWFTYCDTIDGENKWAICSPDILLIDQQFEYIIVIEIKLTFTPLAFQKLHDLYCPVVSKALIWPTHPLVICKRLGASDPLPRLTLLSALGSKEPLITWLGQGPIQW